MQSRRMCKADTECRHMQACMEGELLVLVGEVAVTRREKLL